MNKYRSKKVSFNGYVFDSGKEMLRYQELMLLEKYGKISNLVLQPRFTLQESFKKNGKTYRKIEYIADFAYLDNETMKLVIEDTKGFKTEVYKLKKKLFEYRYPDYKIVEL